MVQLLLEQRAASRAMFSKDISTSITWRLSELVLELGRDQAHRHEWTFCSWNRSHWNIAIQIVQSKGNKSEICSSLHYIVMISMYFLLHILCFKCTHTHTDTDCKFVWCTVLDFKETRTVSPWLPIRCFLACHGASWSLDVVGFIC